jgi:hypothetical protein
MKLAVARSASPGTYAILVTGSGSSAAQSATYTLTIR